MSYFSKAIIVWIDDHFLTPTFKEDKQKNSWHKLFGKIQSNLYRLLDIEIKYIRTAKDALEYIQAERRFKTNSYYYFIVDRKLPFDINDDAVDSNSEDIIKYLQKYQKWCNCLDFSILSSGSPESYAIKNLDYHLKPQNQEFMLPDPLRHKILLHIKEKLVFIEQYDLVTRLKINLFNTEPMDFSTFSTLLYPFIGKYKTFAELEEIGKKDFSTLIIAAPLSVSDKFIFQSTFIPLYDFLGEYNGVNFYKEENYESLKLSGHFEALNELTDQIPLVRLNKLDVESYKNLNNHLKYKHIKVFVIDSFDDNLSNYIDNTSKVKIVKVDTINDSIDITEKLLFALLKQHISSIDLDLENSVYHENSILFIHPLIYTLVTTNKIHLDFFDDPSEIIDFINNYFLSLGLKHLGDVDQLKQNLLNSMPLPEPDFVYDEVKRLCGDDSEKYQKLLYESIKYWLSNAWNVNYNIDTDNYSEDIRTYWQKNSFELLISLTSHIDLHQIDDNDVIHIQQILETINYLNDNLNTKSISTSKILWPHEKFPMPSYIQNQLYKTSNKKLYIQDKDLSLIEDSIELENSHKNLEYKIEYYRAIFDLINASSEYFPKTISGFVLDLTKRIQNNEPIFLDGDKVILSDRENFKQLANIFLRIAINFGSIVTDLGWSKISYKPNIKNPNNEDTAGLGQLLSDLRDHVYSKVDIFNSQNIKISCTSYVDSSEHLSFISENAKLFNNVTNKNLLFSRTEKDKKKLFQIQRDKNLSAIDKEKVHSEYLNKLFISNNITLVSQISNLSSHLSQNEHQLKIQKHFGAYSFFAYLADTRNTWEHGDDKAWHRELFVESFIYGFESIWLMQKFILEKAYNENGLPLTKYVEVNKTILTNNREKQFLEKFPTKRSYLEYFDKLYQKEE
jgi:hypothetical protein